MLTRFLRRGTSDEHAKMDRGLERSRRGLLDRLAGVFGPSDITDETWDELEAQLIQADLGVATAGDLVASLRTEARRAGARQASELPELLAESMARALEVGPASGDTTADAGGSALRADGGSGPRVVLVVGVNGSGKTTTIAKLAALLRADGAGVVLVAADTFRAAAIEQLQLWGARIGVPVVAGQQGGDPGAVVFDALGSSHGRAADIVIIDTAGRLHTQANLMAELDKIRRVAARAVPGAPHETLLVLDATTGQNGLAQARSFADSVGITGLVLAKLDSSAKGGIAFAVTREMGVPIQYVGTGEDLADLAVFEPRSYVEGLLGRPSADPSGGT